MTVLTRDNIQLSSLIKAHVERAETGIAINCNRSELPTEVMNFIQESRAVSTRRAYASDLQQFMEWGGTIPATSEMISNRIKYIRP